MTTSPIDVIANAIRVADGNHTLGTGALAEVAARSLSADTIIANAVDALAAAGWGEAAGVTKLEPIARVVLGSVGGAS